MGGRADDQSVNQASHKPKWHRPAAAVGVFVLFAGMLFWTKLRLVSDIPRSAYAVPGEHAAEPADAPTSETGTEPGAEPEAEPVTEPTGNPGAEDRTLEPEHTEHTEHTEPAPAEDDPSIHLPEDQFPEDNQD